MFILRGRGLGVCCLPKSKLLVAVSSPWASQRLCGPIADVVGRLAAEVVVAHVARQRDEDESESDARQRGEETLKIFIDAMEATGLSAEGVMLFSDDVAKAILNTAKGKNCSVVVVGFGRDKGMLKRILGRDVVQELLRQTDMPILLCPAEWHGTL